MCFKSIYKWTTTEKYTKNNIIKNLTSYKRRDILYGDIMNRTIYGIGIVSAEEIDEMNILQATYKAMRMAIDKLSKRPEVLLNDAVIIPGIDESIHQEKIIKGDAKSVSIAAAMILCPTTGVLNNPPCP